MAGVLESVRDCAQRHPISVAAGLMIALPGTYLYITGKSVTCAVGLCDAVSPSSSPAARLTRSLSVYDSENLLGRHISLPISKWSDKPAPAFMVRVVQGTGKTLVLVFTSVGEHLGIDVSRVWTILEERWVSHFSASRLASVAVTTALPGAFLIFIQKHPESWAARHKTAIANALHILALVTVANQRISVQDLLVAALVMVSFEALHRSVDSVELGAKDTPSALETLLERTHNVVVRSDITGSPQPRARDKDKRMSSDSSILTTGSRDEEIGRLHASLTAAKTAEKAKDHELKRVQAELHNARDTLNETFGEYASLRDEMKTLRQSMGRDHQAVIYRKDIELFALRKANEQKENHIKEREAKVEDVYRTQKATLELKDAQIRNLKDRVAFLERAQSPRLGGAELKVDSAVGTDSQAAVQVKLLRIKGRSSEEIERVMEEKETEIAQLKLDLAKAISASEALEKTQDELRRAWDSTYEAQNALSEERTRHSQTQSKLQEAALKIEDETRKHGAKNSVTALPTIEEQDKKELEAMFNAAQEDNLRLYKEVETLDKRVREANAKVFSTEQCVEGLKEQVRIEKAINEDMEGARPSLVHRVHYQRMEGMLKESREEIEKKIAEILGLKGSVKEVEDKLKETRKEKETAATEQQQLSEENEKLKKAITELEATKEQLMLDHERLANNRARARHSSAEHTSARSSGITLTPDAPAATSDEPLPARPVPSIQSTPERHVRSDTNRLSLISNDVPPPELRTSRRKSLTLKGLVRKFTGKDANTEDKPDKITEKEKEKVKDVKEKPKVALMPKDKNLLIRPKTAVPTDPLSKKETTPPLKAAAERPKTAALPSNERPLTAAERPKTAALGTGLTKERPKMTRANRYYATEANGRPMTATVTGAPDKADKAGDKAEKERPKSRGWGSGRKLVRRSIV